MHQQCHYGVADHFENRCEYANDFPTHDILQTKTRIQPSRIDTDCSRIDSSRLLPAMTENKPT